MNQEEREAHRHLVLVIEDDQDLRDIVSEVLGTHGYRTECAIDGKDALSKLGDGRRPCVILLDLMMPVMDGFQFREEQGKDPAIADIPVVAITAAGKSVSSRIDAAEVLPKPFGLDEVRGAIERYC